MALSSFLVSILFWFRSPLLSRYISQGRFWRVLSRLIPLHVSVTFLEYAFVGAGSYWVASLIWLRLPFVQNAMNSSALRLIVEVGEVCCGTYLIWRTLRTQTDRARACAAIVLWTLLFFCEYFELFALSHFSDPQRPAFLSFLITLYTITVHLSICILCYADADTTQSIVRFCTGALQRPLPTVLKQ